MGGVRDVITCAKFQIEIFMGYDFTWGRIFDFAIDFSMGLTKVQRYCAACDMLCRNRRFQSSEEWRIWHKQQAYYCVQCSINFNCVNFNYLWRYHSFNFSSLFCALVVTQLLTSSFHRCTASHCTYQNTIREFARILLYWTGIPHLVGRFQE